MALSDEARQFIVGSKGITRREIKDGAKALGYTGVTDRQIINVQKGSTPEKLAKSSIRPTDSIQESWKRNAVKTGKDTKIRGNADYKAFRKQIEKQQQILRQVEKGFTTRKDYVKGRLKIYLNFGLIDQEAYDAYLASVK